MSYFILAQLSPCHIGKQFQLRLTNVNTAYTTLLFNGMASKDHIFQRAVFGNVSHLKAKPTGVVNGCNLFSLMQIRCSI